MALITEGAGGIGGGAARVFAREGAKLTVADVQGQRSPARPLSSPKDD